MRRTLAVVVVAMWALIGVPGTAHAGGPTSVLITQPVTGEATALYYSSGAYADLERLLAESGAEAPTSMSPADSGGAAYNLAWMIHDAQPWRLDNVQFTGDGTAYVATTLVSESGLGESASWHEVAQPRRLAAILDQVFSGVAARTAALPAADTEADAAPVQPGERWFSLTGWRWVVPGVLGGLLVGPLVGLVDRRRRVPAEPRRVLVDGEPQRAGR